MSPKRELVVFIAMSLDGYIADSKDDISFLDRMDNGKDDYGYHEFIETVDTVILGYRTYEKVMTLVSEFPHKDRTSYVITHRQLENNTHFNTYSGSIKDLIDQIRSKEGKNIFCDGGGNLVQQLIRENLVDRLIVSVIPVILGNGISLFGPTDHRLLELLEVKSFDTGLVQLHYKFLH